MLRTNIDLLKYRYNYVIGNYCFYTNIALDNINIEVSDICLDTTMDNLPKAIENFWARNFNVVAVVLGGSRVFGLYDEFSDYDLAIIVDSPIALDGKEEGYLVYKNLIGIHWYYTPVASITTLNTQASTLELGRYLIFTRLHQHILKIYNTKQFQDILNHTKFDKLAMDASKLLYYKYKDLIIENTSSFKHKGKYLYFLCLASYIIVGDSININKMNKLKRIRYLHLSDQEEQDLHKFFVSRMQLIQEYI